MAYIYSQEINHLAEAIYNLKSPENYFKDYVLPIITLFLGSFISAGLAYFIARRTNDKAESIKMELRKVSAINYYCLQADFCLQKLYGIKEMYHGRLKANSFQRLLEMPPIIGDYSQSRTIEVTELVFLIKQTEKDTSRWNQISYINMIFKNFDSVVGWIEERNALRVELSNCYLETEKSQKIKTVEGTIDTALDALGREKLTKLIQLTEKIILMIDDLILYFDDFVKEFPEIAKEKINTSILNGMGIIIEPAETVENEYRELMKVRSPKMAYNLFAQLAGLELEYAQEMFRSNYNPSL